jgi:single-strand DNA-binding protein
MAEGLNKAILIGNLGADPELRYTQNNRPVLKFRIATTESYVTESGERKETTYWHSVVMWGKRGEALSKILTKGMRVYVEGRIENREYEKDGIKRWSTDINALNLILVDGRREGAGAGTNAGPATSAPARNNGGAPARAPAKRSGPAEPDFVADGADSDDDIPF